MELGTDEETVNSGRKLKKSLRLLLLDWFPNLSLYHKEPDTITTKTVEKALSCKHFVPKTTKNQPMDEHMLIF